MPVQARDLDRLIRAFAVVETGQHAFGYHGEINHSARHVQAVKAGDETLWLALYADWVAMGGDGEPPLYRPYDPYTNYTNDSASEKVRLVSAFHDRVAPRTL